MKIKNINFLAVALLVISAVQITFVSCKDEVSAADGVDGYYTATKEYAIDYLKNREQFSQFVQVLNRATGENGNLNLPDLLGVYGSYTVFAPTNAAMEQYLSDKGLSSVDQLTKEDCDTLALNSIIEQAFFTTDYSDGTYPQANMLDRNLTISSTNEFDPVKNDSVAAIYIGKTSRLTHYDDSVVNGVVHTVGSVVGASKDMLPQLIKLNEKCQLFADALFATGVSNLMMKYRDESYTVGSDSIDWTNDALVLPTASEYDNVAYMENRYFKYTAFVCPDSILKAKYGVEYLFAKTDDKAADPKSLESLAHKHYDEVFPADASNNDYKDRKNALNRFISYHVLNRLGTYYTLTAVDGGNLQANWNRRKIDITDWYETMMPYSMVKCSFPSGKEEGLYLNRRGVQSRADERGVFIRGAKVASPSEVDFDGTAVNGVYHFIDDIIAYDKNTQDNVFNERLRIDCTTLSPDFMNSGARGHYSKFTANDNGRYGGWDATSNHTNKNTCIGFKPGSAENIIFNNEGTHIHVRTRVPSFWSYQGDEVTILGRFDFTVKLPPVPAGTYEVRFFTCVEFNTRGIIQCYLGEDPKNLKATGIPFDMRWSGEVLANWKSDASLGDDDAIASYDKAMHNNGWMKGMKSFYSATSESGGTQSSCFRDLSRTIRKVIGTFTTDGQTDQYLRIQQKMESEQNACNFDMIEIVPSTVYNNEYYAEDKW